MQLRRSRSIIPKPGQQQATLKASIPHPCASGSDLGEPKFSLKVLVSRSSAALELNLHVPET